MHDIYKSDPLRNALAEMKSDILVLGATGFTGRFAVNYLAKQSENVTWSISARSPTKIQELVQWCHDNGTDISHVPTCILDVTDSKALASALAQVKIVLTCIGPYTTLGEAVVEACLATGTHYVDLSAEIHHILNIYVKYHEAAEKANVLIVPSCAFASLVAATGYIYLTNKFQGTLNHVEVYCKLDFPKLSYLPCTGALASYCTWDSLVQTLLHLKEYQAQKALTFPIIKPPQEIDRGFFHWRRWSLWFPYPGPDQDVMEFSEIYLLNKQQKRLTHVKLYTKMPLFLHYIIIPFMFLYFYLSYFGWFASLLRRYPRIFTLGYMSHNGPSEKKRDRTIYNFSFIGKGWDNSGDYSKPPTKKMQVEVSSKDPYKSSGILIAIAAITILKEQARMPSGGVVNVGAAFYNTSIVDRLTSAGFKYEVTPLQQ